MTFPRVPTRSFVLGSLALAALPWACQSPSAETGVATTSDASTGVAAEAAPLDYPEADRTGVVDEYHGTQVADPYRWLEDPDSPESRAWIEAENELTNGWLAEVPARAAIEAKLTALWSYERFGMPARHGEHYFYSYDDGEMDQPVLCRVADLAAQPEVVLDPNTFSEDGTVSLGGTSFSEDGRYLAYGLSDGGSDWRTWYVRDLDTGTDLEDRLEWAKFTSPAWTHDGAGFFYGRFPETDDRLQAQNENQRVYYHRIGTEQSEDALVYEDPEHPRRMASPVVTDDGRYLLFYMRDGTSRNNGLYVRDLGRDGAELVRLFDEFDASYVPIANEGALLWIRTDKDAPRGRVVQVDARRPGGPMIEVVPEREEALQGVSRVGDKLFASYLVHAKTLVRIHALDGKPEGELELPGIGSASGFGGKPEDTETFFSFTSFTTPAAIYRYDLASGESSVFKRPEIPFDPERFTTRQVFYASPDGTRIPMFITHAKGMAMDGARPTILNGYGGFNIAITPGFSPPVACWLEMGGIYAVANLRGGGEYGRDWHLAGTKENKQNVFDDFIAAGEWLVAEKVTRPNRLAIMGGSNGGLLVGACVNQRPDLFGAALPAVGVMDMLRYHEFTIGAAWASDYGRSDDAEMFPHLLAYSPVHNVADGTDYPATFITTGDHDDRVVPGHSFKYAAAMQHAQAGPAPILIRIETRAGHGAGKSRAQSIQEASDRWTFLARTFDMQVALD